VLIGANKWMERGACQTRGADPAIFSPGDAFDEDADERVPSPEAMEYCDECPVRVDCFTHAFVLHLEGTWGGTTSYQREQLRRPLSRASCPVCGSQSLHALVESELCLDCGSSWRLPR